MHVPISTFREKRKTWRKTIFHFSPIGFSLCDAIFLQFFLLLLSFSCFCHVNKNEHVKCCLRYSCVKCCKNVEKKIKIFLMEWENANIDGIQNVDRWCCGLPFPDKMRFNRIFSSIIMKKKNMNAPSLGSHFQQRYTESVWCCCLKPFQYSLNFQF